MFINNCLVEFSEYSESFGAHQIDVDPGFGIGDFAELLEILRRIWSDLGEQARTISRNSERS